MGTRVLLKILIVFSMGLVVREGCAVQTTRVKHPTAGASVSVRQAAHPGASRGKAAAKAHPTAHAMAPATPHKKNAVQKTARHARTASPASCVDLRKSATLPKRKAKSTRSAKITSPAQSTLVSLRGSRESMERQNATVASDGLGRIEDEKGLKDNIARKALVPVPVSTVLAVSEDLPEDRRYCRPWTASFLGDLARAHAVEFHKPVTVSSAVRTVDFQKQLRKRNSNAAAAEGDIVSPHVTGATIDIAKKGMSLKELLWMRKQLLGLVQQSKIDVAEEFRQSCFHITVYKNYQPPAPLQKVSAPVPPPARQQSRPSNGMTPPLLARWFEGL